MDYWLCDYQITRRGHIKPLSLWLEQWSVLTRMTPTLSGYGFAFPAWSASSCTTSQVLQNAWLIDTRFPHNIVSDQWIYFTVKRRWHVEYNYETHLSCYIPNHLEEASMIKWWNGQLNTQLWHHLGNTICRIRVLSSKMQYMHWTKSWYMVSCPQYLGINEVEVGLTLFTVTPKDPFVKFVLPILAVLISVRL